MFLQIFVVCLCFGLRDALIADQGCVDADNDCRLYQADTCTAIEYRPWAEANCRATCGFCTPSNTTPRDCTDTIRCKLYDTPPGSLCRNPVYKIWIEDNCPSFCHLTGCQ